MQRREILQLASGAAITLLLPTQAVWAQNTGAPPPGPQVPLAANAPWRQAGQVDGDWRNKALSYALLAPNPHNLQPWIADLRVPEQITFLYDTARALPMTDPLGRQLLIGCGCFLELLELAANEANIAIDISVFPAGEPSEKKLNDQPIAVVRRASRASKADPLFAQILRRRSTKTPYDVARPLPERTPQELALAMQRSARQGLRLGVVCAQSDASVLASLRDLTWDAWLVEFVTQRTWKETVDLMRIGSDEVIANPDGVSLGSPFFDQLKKAGQINREGMLDINSPGNKMAQQRYEALLKATPAIVWISSSSNSRTAQLETGRAYARVALAATAQGLCMQPVSQALQEFPEMATSFNKLSQLLPVAQPGRLQMLARIGFGPEAEPTPRRPVQALLRQA